MQFSWRPGFGDPTIIGWVTVALYAVAVFSCWLTLRRMQPSRERQIWQFIALLFLALGLNKQLDLQTALIEAGRLFASHEGWYGQRRAVQLAFTEGLAISCLAIAIALIHWARTTSAACWVALFGTCIVLGFVLLRTAAFDHVHAFLSQSALAQRWNWTLEVGGISIVILSCFWRRSEPI